MSAPKQTIRQIVETGFTQHAPGGFVSQANMTELVNFFTARLTTYRYTGGKTSGHDSNIDTLRAFVADQFGSTIEATRRSSQKREDVECRQVLFYTIYQNTSMSNAAIGREFGGRDHSTVIHGRNTVVNLMDSDKRFRAKVEQCLNFAKLLFQHEPKREIKNND